MYESIIEILLNGGPMALFAAYLVWSKNKQDEKADNTNLGLFKRLDEINEKHEAVRAAMEDKYDTKTEQVRERWIEVVKKAEAERDEAQKALQYNVNALSGSVEQLKGEITKQTAEISKLCDRVFQLGTSGKDTK
jgi:hypothetical protein